MTRLLYLVSHPIQYQAPLLRLIAAQPDIRLRVVFERCDTEGGYFDQGFGTRIHWDVPLRDGFDSVALAETDLRREIATADVIWLHGWGSRIMLEALSAARNAGKPILMRGENWDGAMPDGSGLRGWIKRRLLDWVFKRTAAFLTIGSKNREYYLRHGIEESRLFPVPYAVDNEFFAVRADLSPPERLALRRRLGLPEDRRIILFAGKFQARKRPDLIAAAWSQLPEPRPALLFVGDGEMRPALENTLRGSVVFAGFRNQTELPALYALADVFVLPSEREPWGLAINEAMACGTAVVATDQVGAAFDLVHPDCGRMIPAGNAAALAHALGEVLVRPEEMGAAATRRVADWSFAANLDGLRRAIAHVR